MITAKDAIEELAVLKESAEGKTKEALSAAVTAVDQNISKKPKLRAVRYPDDTLSGIMVLCPSCGAEVQLKHCLNCGQALDWSELES